MPGLLRGVARTAVVAGTATAVSGRVSRRQQSRWAAQEPEPQPEPEPQQYEQAPPPPAAAGPARDVAEQLKDLAALKEQGILTDTEFSAQKARILAG